MININNSKNNDIIRRNKIKKSKRKKAKTIIPESEIRLDKKNDLLKNDRQPNQNKKKRKSNIIETSNDEHKRKRKRDLNKKIKLEKKMNKRYKNYEDIFNKFNAFNKEELYELHKKIYTKTDNELNGLSYKGALKYDKRTYFTYYLSLIKCKHLLFFSFHPKFDFNARIIKIYLFFFNFTTFFFVNALFFTDKQWEK